MAGWAGFSEEELRKMKHLKDSSDSNRRPPSTNKSRQQLQREKVLKQQIQRAGQEDGRAQVHPEEQLCKTKTRPSPAQPAAVEDGTTKIPEVPQTKMKLEPVQNHVEIEQEKKELHVEENPVAEIKEVELRDKSRLDLLHQEQRLMEEKNKRKKALLAKAIAERSKKTHAETVKLKRIQKELQALDDLVSSDISILRNRIDQACLDFTHAKKRFDKAEAEYIASKLDLHKKTESKEQLAEHLCTIIQQNEQRKAKKLEELMQQLEVETDEEKMELEIEVERLLHQQETGARRQAPQTNIVTALPRIEDPVTVLTTAVENEGHEKAALTVAAEKPVDHSLDHAPPDREDQGKTGPSEIPVEAAT